MFVCVAGNVEATTGPTEITTDTRHKYQKNRDCFVIVLNPLTLLDLCHKRRRQGRKKEKIQMRPGAVWIVHRAQDLTSVHKQSSLTRLDDSFKTHKHSCSHLQLQKPPWSNLDYTACVNGGYYVDLCTFQRSTHIRHLHWGFCVCVCVTSFCSTCSEDLRTSRNWVSCFLSSSCTCLICSRGHR